MVCDFSKLFFYSVLVVSGLGSPIVNAQTKVGFAGNGVSHFDSSIRFGDVFKSSMEFQTSSTPFYDFEEFAKDDPRITLDQNGYPLEIKSSGPYVNSNMLQNLPAPFYPTGTFTIVITGSGEIRLGGDARHPATLQPQIFEGPGSFQFQISQSTAAGLQLAITRSDLSNPITKIQIYLPGLTPGYPGEPWNPDFIEFANQFAVRSFVEVSNVNSIYEDFSWEMRTRPDFQTQAVQTGLALELQVQLINLLDHTAGHFFVPGFATEDYIRNMAVMLRDQIEDKTRPIYIEHGNEMFDPYLGGLHARLHTQADSLMGSAGVTKLEALASVIAERYLSSYPIFKEEFGPQANRLKRVISGSLKDSSLMDQLINETFKNGPYIFDVVASDAWLYDKFSSGDCQIQQIENSISTYLNGEFQSRLSVYNQLIGDYEHSSGRSDIEFMNFNAGLLVLDSGSCFYQAMAWQSESQEMANLYTEYLNILNSHGSSLVTFFRDTQYANYYFGFGHMSTLYQSLEELTRLPAIFDFIDSTYPSHNFWNACAADMNRDGIFDNGDIGLFISYFLGQNLKFADINGDGIVDHGDISSFIQGCP